MTELALLPASIEGASFTGTALRITEPNLSYEDFEKLARGLVKMKTATSWWLGDLVNFGEAVYGERYAQAMDVTGYSYEHLRDCAYVCRRIARSRRRDNLGFSIHREVAPLEPNEQTEWLDAAIANAWTVRELRDRLRESRPKEPQTEPIWSDDEPPSEDPLSREKVEEAEQHARKTLERPLPPGHPLWETQAKSHARDVVSLAKTVEHEGQSEIASGFPSSIEGAKPEASLVDAVRRLKAQAQRTAIGEFYRVPCEALDEVAALAGEETDGDLEKET